MTEWVAIFRESGLRDDVSVENLREACLQLVVCARARARELQVDVQVERASRAVVAANTVTPNKGRPTLAMESAVSSSSRLKGVSLGMSANINIRARMVSAFDVVQMGARFLHVHDLQRPSLEVKQSNRLKVRDVLHRPRLRRNLPRVPRLRHNLRRMVPKEAEKGEEGQVFYQAF